MQANSFMKSFFIGLIPVLLLVNINTAKAQYTWNSDSAFKAGKPQFRPNLGICFRQIIIIKRTSDSLKRGGSNQYTGIPKDRMPFSSKNLSWV